MSKMLGQILIEKGVIQRRQLRAALKRQLIFGGHLGTNLIELGLLDETALGQVLAEVHGVPRAPLQAFQEIPAAIVRLVPEALVRKRRIIPFGVEGHTLHLAMVDPGDRTGLSLSLGHRVQPYVAPEMRVLESMERYYGIRRPMRFVRVAQPDQASDLDPRTAEPPTPRRVHPFAVNPDPFRREVRAPDDRSELPAELREVSKRMSVVGDHAELGEVILEFAGLRMQRCILFGVADENAEPANWKGIELDGARARQVSLQLGPDSIFSLCVDDAFYHGALPEDRDLGPFYEALGICVPRECLILPVYGDERLEAVVYGDSGAKGRIEGTSESYRQFLELIGLSMKMLAIRRQLAGAAAAGVDPESQATQRA